MTFDVYRIDRTKHWGTYNSIKEFKDDLSRTYTGLIFRVIRDPDIVIVLDVNQPIAMIRHEITPEFLEELGISVHDTLVIQNCIFSTMVKI